MKENIIIGILFSISICGIAFGLTLIGNALKFHSPIELSRQNYLNAVTTCGSKANVRQDYRNAITSEAIFTCRDWSKVK